MSKIENLDQFLGLVEAKAIPGHLCEAWGGKDPRQIALKAKSAGWFRRHPVLMGTLVFAFLMVISFMPFVIGRSATSILINYFGWWLAMSAVLISIAMALWHTSSAKENAWLKVGPFAETYDQMLETLGLTAAECAVMEEEALRLLAEREMVDACKDVLEYQRRTHKLPPTDKKLDREKELRKKVAQTYDALIPFELVSADGFGPYYEMAANELYGEAA
ncbi:MAG: hypothetical protein QOE22_58 [Candidatus Parcubacteria bacterium]|jgi:hypothetical protein|nr:hypothetical protein [Candidatus Parcubacteria bacterium]